MKIANLKLGIHRGAPRLWIEGKKLAGAGFLTGDRYVILSAADKPHQLEILKRPNGDRFPSGRVSVEFYPNVIHVIDSAIAEQIENGSYRAEVVEAVA